MNRKGVYYNTNGAGSFTWECLYLMLYCAAEMKNVRQMASFVFEINSSKSLKVPRKKRVKLHTAALNS